MTAKDRGIGMVSVKVLSLLDYVEGALKRAEYYRDENRVVIGEVPGVAGFFAQGDSFEDARENLKDVIDGNILLALQLGLEIPCFEEVEIGISREEWINARSDMCRNSKNKNYCSSL